MTLHMLILILKLFKMKMIVPLFVGLCESLFGFRVLWTLHVY